MKKVHVHRYKQNRAAPNQDGASHYYLEVSSMLPHFVASETVRFHNIVDLSTLEQVQDEDVVLCLLGPYAYLYAWHRHITGRNYTIIRDIHTAFWEGYLLQERLYEPLRREQDKVLFPSYYAREVHRKFFPFAEDEQGWAVLYPFLETLPPADIPASGSIENRTANDRQEAGMRLGYLGSLAEDKNLLDLLQAMAEVKRQRPETSLYYCGVPYSPSCRPEVIRERLCEAGFADDEICYGGILERRDLPKFFSSIDLLLFPSTSSVETLGRVVLEAIHFGVPAIAADHGAMRELLPEDRRVPVRYRYGESIPLTKAEPLGYIDPAQLAEAIINSDLRRPESAPALGHYRYATFACWMDSFEPGMDTHMSSLEFDWHWEASTYPVMTTAKEMFHFFYDIYGHDGKNRQAALKNIYNSTPALEYAHFVDKLEHSYDWMDLGSFPRIAWSLAGTGTASVQLEQKNLVRSR